jgi:TPR repeat protein
MVWFKDDSPVEQNAAPQAHTEARVEIVPIESADTPAASSREKLAQEAMRGNAGARKKLCEQWLGIAAVVHDYREAVAWCLLAAQSGDVQAQVELARLYQVGNGVAADAQEAMKWYELAVLQDNEQAMYMLGRMLVASDSSADQARGMALLQQAAAKGHRNAKWELQKLGTAEEPHHDQTLLAPARE